MASRRVGRRQWKVLGVLATEAPRAVVVSDALMAAGYGDTRGSMLDSVRGMLNSGLISHACGPWATCRQASVTVGMACRIAITTAGESAKLGEVGRRPWGNAIAHTAR